jgi:hypothetical protein
VHIAALPLAGVSTTRQLESREGSTKQRQDRADLITVGLVVLLVMLTIVVGTWRDSNYRDISPAARPVHGVWLLHVGPGTLVAVAVAALVVCSGPGLARRLPWRRAIALTYAGAVAWTAGLSLIDGWEQGIATRLTQPSEYLAEVARVDTQGIAYTLQTFTDHILDGSSDSWTTHVSAHPPGATLVFVVMHRAGLGGGVWAAVVCVGVGCLAAVAVPATLRSLGAADAARSVLPFCVLFPGGVWMGVSADGMFAGLTAAAVAMSAWALTRRGIVSTVTCGASGVVLGFSLYLSYGLVLLAPVVLTVGVLAVLQPPLQRGRDDDNAGTRIATPLQVWPRALAAVAGAGGVVICFTVAGFWWVEGYQLLVERYYQGIAASRPYTFWLWANVAALFLATGPAVAAGLRRICANVAAGQWGERTVPALVGAALLSVVVADLTGLSKSEVERIWLPFAVWLATAVAAIPGDRQLHWLAGQAAIALIVNHTVLTNW